MSEARLGFWVLLFACVIPAPSAECAQPSWYPTKPIRVIVPFSPGGGTDFIARLVGIKLTEKWGQAVIIDNRPGAGSVLGTNLVANSAPDGYTIGIVSTEHTVMPSLQKQLPYNPVTDFSPISQNVRQSYIVAIHPDVKATSMQELMSVIKARNGGFVWGAAHGSVGHLAGEMLKQRAGLQMIFVPYKGTGPALIDLLGGQISLTFSNPLAVMPHIKANRLRALAITSTSRSAIAPELPTVAEATSLPGFEASGWNGFLAPRAVPAHIVAELNNAIVSVLGLPDVRERIARDGSELVASKPAEFAAHIHQEVGKWAKVVREAGMKFE